MAAKFKGIYKGFKSISHIFVGKETGLEIGYPTDVKHVAHIGSDGSTGSSPSWMSEFKGGSESFSPRQSFATARQSNSSSLSLDYDQTMGQQQSMAEMLQQPIDLPNIPRKQRHKKKSSSSSSRQSSSKCSSTSSSSSRSAISKSTYKSATSVLN